MELFVSICIAVAFMVIFQTVLDRIAKLTKTKLPLIVIEAVLTAGGLILVFSNKAQGTVLIALSYALFFVGTSELYHTIRGK